MQNWTLCNSQGTAIASNAAWAGFCDFETKLMIHKTAMLSVYGVKYFTVNVQWGKY